MQEKIRIHHADAYEIINQFKKENIKVNHIICDPPYNISAKHNFNTLNNPRQGVYFGLWDINFDLFSWIKPYSKLIEKNGSFIIFCSYKYISFIIKELGEVGFITKDVLIWQKNNPMPRNIKRRYVQDMEFAIWAVKKGAKWVFNKPDDKVYLRSLFSFPIVSGNERSKHPTQKSLALMQQIINIHTNIDDVILDPFMGSGSTGVAAIKNNRKFIGVEIDEKYYKIAEKRLFDDKS
ncbi:DNA-methyltransferase [Mycoplasma sp. 4423]